MDLRRATLEGLMHQWQLHSAAWIGPRVEVDAALYRGGLLGIPAYTRLDRRAELKLADRLSAAFVGRNLLDRQHAEFGSPRSAVVPTLVPRDADVHQVWRVVG